MAAKKELFDSELNALADRAKALAHPARLSILNVLAEKKECICGEVVDELPLAQSSVSQHLKELKKAGFIKGKVEGPRTCYCINYDIVNEFKENLGAMLDRVGSKPVDECC